MKGEERVKLQEAVGGIYENGCGFYMLSQTGPDQFRMISISCGNRWGDRENKSLEDCVRGFKFVCKNITDFYVRRITL